MSWSTRMRCLSHLLTHVVSFLLPVVSTLFLSWTRGAGSVLSHLNSLTHRLPHCPLRGLVLPHHAHCVLSHLRSNGHSLMLNSFLSGIGRIENPLCSACVHPLQHISHLILHCPATDSLCCLLLSDSFSLKNLCSRLWRVFQLLELHGLPPCPSSLARGRIRTTRKSGPMLFLKWRRTCDKNQLPSSKGTKLDFTEFYGMYFALFLLR